MLEEKIRTAAPGDETELAICEGCSNDIPAGSAHNETSTGTFCENCNQLAG